MSWYKLNDIKISKNFNLKEFECKDGSHQVVVDSELVHKLQKLRDELNNAIIINSAYRNESHNKAVGGSPNSQHLLGKAVDISLHNQDVEAQSIANIARDIGFNGIGIYDTFIHLDVRDGKFASWNNKK